VSIAKIDLNISFPCLFLFPPAHKEEIIHQLTSSMDPMEATSEVAMFAGSSQAPLWLTYSK